MRDFFASMSEHLSENPNKVIISEGAGGKETTRRELDNLSGKVYRYLKEKCIGKEDIVTILLPRGVYGPVALLGVWKAGACAVLLEYGMPEERVDFIKKDCGSEVVIDERVWEEIQGLEALRGNEPFDPHAAAYVVYTSGTSGRPKGVLHEYGGIPLLYESCHFENKPMYVEEDILALISPLNFVASVMSIIYSFYEGTMLLIVPYVTIQNLQTLETYFIVNKATATFFTASLFRMITDFGPYLKKVFISSEPANGIWRPKEEMTVWNIYCSSESGTIVSVARLDEPNEIASVGTPQYDVNIYILDENGKEVENGKVGEICYDVPYTRGYMGGKTVDNSSFDGRIFHSGDLARRLDNGEYQLIGRISDTIKINGNRVEPAEVEAAIKKVTGLKWTAVKGFVDETRSYLCAYFTEDRDIDTGTLRDKLSSLLPAYMIPTYYIKIKDIPRNKNGKLDKDNLPPADSVAYRAAYLAPQNDTERVLCSAMAKVLGVDRFSACDDFYLVGGDSLLSMMLLTETELPGLAIEDVYRGRTPQKIAKIYHTKSATVQSSIDEINLSSMRRPHPLSPEQKYILSYQRHTPNSTMYNLFMLVRVTGASAEELIGALSHVIGNHPAILTELQENENGEVLQHYVVDDMPKMVVENISKKDFEEIKKALVRPYNLMNSPLFRCRVFSVEQETYFFFDVHHIIFDGFSVQISAGELYKALKGKKLSTDYYYYILSQREKEKASSVYQAAEKYFTSRYPCDDFMKNLPYDHKSKDNKSDSVTLPLAFSEKQFTEFQARTGLGRNGFFITAVLMALSVFTGFEKVMVTWAFNGRNNLQSQNSIGALYHILPAALDIKKDRPIVEIFRDVKDQIEKGIEYSSFSFVRSAFSKPVEDDCICVLFQGDMYKLDFETEVRLEEIKLTNEYAAAQNSLDVEIIKSEKGYLLYLDYAASRYEKDTIRRFGELVCETAGKLLI